jgi:hypothetical protein
VKSASVFIGERGPLTGNAIVSALELSSESTFTRHFVPALKMHGVKNRSGRGYYVGEIS